ncbi:response regulator [bacterium]|nr:response regulator [bacterium]
MGKRIFLCTNSITLQKVVEWSLADNDYDFVHVKNVKEVKNILKRDVPNLIILDQDLPGNGGGISLCAEIKSSQKHAGIPVIFLLRELDSDEKENEESSVARNCKAEKILGMPFESRELENTVKKLLQSSLSETDQSIKKASSSARKGEASLTEEFDKDGESTEKIESKDIDLACGGLDKEMMEKDREGEVAEIGVWESNIREESYEKGDTGFEHSLTIWLKGIVQEEIGEIIERMVPKLTKKIVQDQIEKLIDKETLAKIIDQNREFISKIMADEAPNIVREVAERMVPEMAEKIIREEIERIKQGYC